MNKTTTPRGIKERLEKLGMGHLRYLGEMASIGSVDNIVSVFLRGRKIQDLKEEGVWDDDGQERRAFVYYETSGGTIKEVDENGIQERAQIETNEGKELCYVVGSYSINRRPLEDKEVMAILCVKELQKMNDGRVLGRFLQAFDLDKILRYDGLPFEKPK